MKFKKFDAGKLEWEMMPEEALEEVMAQDFLDKNLLLLEARNILRDEKNLINSFNKEKSTILISQNSKRTQRVTLDSSDKPSNVIPLFIKNSLK